MLTLRGIALAFSAVALSGCGIIDFDSPCQTCGSPSLVYNPYTGTSSYVYPQSQSQSVPIVQPYPGSSSPRPSSSSDFTPSNYFSDGTPHSTATQPATSQPAPSGSRPTTTCNAGVSTVTGKPHSCVSPQ